MAGQALMRSEGSAPQEDAANVAVLDTTAAAHSAGVQSNGADASAANDPLRDSAAAAQSVGALGGAGAEAAALDEDMPDSAAVADSAGASESEGSHDNSPESAGAVGSAEQQRRTRRTLLPKVGGRSFLCFAILHLCVWC